MDEAFEVGWLEAHRLHLARPVARAEIVGIGHVMQALESLVGLLRDPARGAAMGARAPRGILLWGDPGVGKTLSARYLAGAVGNLPMYEVAADELSPARVRGLFGHLAAAHARCILYLDEVDLIALNRSTELHSEGTRATLVALLAALDGLRDTAGPILVASSNRSPYELDPALLRAGRIGYHVRFGLPSAAERRELLEVFLRGRPLEPDVDPAALAAYALRATPASLAQAVDDAAGGAIARGAARIGQADLVVAIARAGEIEPDEGEGGSEGARALAALHEGGHVAVAVALRGPTWVTRVRLEPRGGRTTVGSEDVPLEALPVGELRDRLAVYYGGIEAEEVLARGASLGGAEDVSRATQLAGRMVTAGIAPGVPAYPPEGLGRRSSGLARDGVALAVAALLAEARLRAARIVGPAQLSIQRFADLLLAAGGVLADEALREAIAEAGLGV